MIYTIDGRSPHTAGDRCYVAPGADIIGDVFLDTDSSVWFGAVIRGDEEHIHIGRGSNIQDVSILHTDPGAPLHVGERVTVGHRVMLHGCRIGDQSLIGIGSTILNHAVIGGHSIVGAHSLVTEGKSFPDGVLILGAPAKVVRELTADERTLLKESAERYIARARSYRSGLEALDAIP